MPSFETHRRVNHTAQNMFDLVADVARYPQFLPLCESTHLRGRKKVSETCEIIVADMTAAYKIVRETFTTRATLDRGNLMISIEYLDGPFKHLDNRWTFEPLTETSCDVHFHISYEFRSRALSALMGTVFDKAFRKFAAAFEERADEIYGRADAAVRRA